MDSVGPGGAVGNITSMGFTPSIGAAALGVLAFRRRTRRGAGHDPGGELRQRRRRGGVPRCDRRQFRRCVQVDRRRSRAGLGGRLRRRLGRAGRMVELQRQRRGRGQLHGELPRRGGGPGRHLSPGDQWRERHGRSHRPGHRRLAELADRQPDRLVDRRRANRASGDGFERQRHRRQLRLVPVRERAGLRQDNQRAAGWRSAVGDQQRPAWRHDPARPGRDLSRQLRAAGQER